VAALAIGARWGYYRYQNIVLGEASIKGTITKIGARIDGRIKSIEVETGQQVSRGQVLLRLEDRHLQAALDRANAELKSAVEDLETEKMAIEQMRRRLTLEIGRLKGLRKKVQGELEAQQSSLVRLQKQYDRVATLLRSGAASVAEMDKIIGDRDRAQANVSAAMGQLEAAEANYEKATSELEGLVVREARLKLLESNVVVAQSRIAEAEADLDAAVIRAPDDGRVLERIIELGGSARVGEAMLSLWIGRPWVEAWADERDLYKFKIGSRADVSLDTNGRRKLSGRVEAIGLVSDKMQGPAVPSTLHALIRRNAMVPVRIALDSDSSEVQLGLSAVVGIQKEPESAETVARKGPAAVRPIAGTLGQPRGE
jgi:multidrug resistance efflux pump